MAEAPSRHWPFLVFIGLLALVAAFAGCDLIKVRSARSVCEAQPGWVLVHAYTSTWACVPGKHVDG